MTFEVRRLSEHDAALYRDIRLEGLALEPTSFASTLDQEAAFSDDDWRSRLSRNCTFGVFDDAGLVGIATYYAETGAKTAHRGHLVGVYVRPRARGTGAAALLVQAVVESAQGHLAFLYLAVNQTNSRAVRFYERVGFTLFGRDPGGLMVDGTMYEDYLMMLRLDRE